MERIQALVVWLALIIIGLGIWVGQPASFFSNPTQQRQQGKDEGSRCFPALFSFGSSVADTGMRETAFPPGDRGEVLYGSTFFGKHSRRYTDGRMHIDFWAMALKLPFLDAYFKSLGSNFRRGVNFAAAGATARNITLWSPFYLSIQLNQFREFKRDVLAILEEGPTTRNSDFDKLPVKEFFQDGLYMLAIGSNDINHFVLNEGLPFQDFESTIPEITKEIVRVLEVLYAEGARHILVEDVYPAGCSSVVLTMLAEKYSDQLDDVGCLKPVNELVQLHNALLRKGIAELGKRLPDASIAVVDTYRRRYDIIANHDEYGFKNPLKACCGAGGPYNFRPACLCGRSTMEKGVPVITSVCENVSSHVWWDGAHFTDAFNHATMKGILTGDYFEPSFDLIRNGCDLVEI